MTIIEPAEPPEHTIVAWWDPNDDLHAVAYRTDQHVEPGAETYRWYITDTDGHGDPLAWHELLSEMQGFRGPSVLMSRGRLEMPSTVVEPAGPRPGAPTMTIIPGYRLAQIKISSALSELERIAQAVAKERDGVARAHEATLQEVGQLRARIEELEAQPEVAEAVRRLDAIDEDPDGGHSEAEEILLACVPAEVREAHQRLVERMPWWVFA